MGALGGVMLVKRNQQWPGVDAEHDEYKLDVAIVTGRDGSRSRHTHHHHPK
jgi:hypothetical protein